MNRDALWAFAVAMFVFGDLATTTVGIHLGLVESHPLYASVLPGDLLALAFAIKLVLLAGFVTLYQFVPEPARLGIPVGLTILGTAVTLWNSFLILSVV